MERKPGWGGALWETIPKLSSCLSSWNAPPGLLAVRKGPSPVQWHSSRWIHRGPLSRALESSRRTSGLGQGWSSHEKTKLVFQFASTTATNGNLLEGTSGQWRAACGCCSGRERIGDSRWRWRLAGVQLHMRTCLGASKGKEGRALGREELKLCSQVGDHSKRYDLGINVGVLPFFILTDGAHSGAFIGGYFKPSCVCSTSVHINYLSIWLGCWADYGTHTPKGHEKVYYSLGRAGCLLHRSQNGLREQAKGAGLRVFLLCLG